MDMADYEAVAERFHGVGKNIPADRLNDIFYEFGAITFNPPPLARSCTLVGYGVAAKLVDAHAGLYIAQPPAGWKVNEQHSALIVNLERLIGRMSGW